MGSQPANFPGRKEQKLEGAGMDLKELEVEVQQLEDVLRSQEKTTRTAGRVPVFISLALMLIIGGFVLVNYVRLRAELTAEKFAKSIKEELVEVTPVAIREFNLLGKDLLPVYTSEFQKQFAVAWPGIAKKLETETSELGNNVLLAVHQNLNETEQRVLDKTQQVLFASYPPLGNAKDREQLSRKLHSLSENALVKALGNFDAKFSRDIDKLQSALMKFDLNDSSDSTVDLQKKFLHLWLQLLDQEIMAL